MKPTLLLHVGPHKTGTTAIQKALTEQRAALQERGWAYPRIGFDYFGHHLFAEALTPARGSELPAMVAAVVALQCNVVLSSENFSRTDAAGWSRLRDLLGGRCTVRIVYMLRSPLSLLFSSWQEAVKHGASETLAEYLLRHVAAPFASPVLNPTTCLDALAAAFGRDAIELHSYEQAVDSAGGLVAHVFRNVLGAPPPSDPGRYEQVNKSFGLIAVELIRILTRAGLPAVKLMLEDAELRALARAIEERAAPYVRTLPLRMDNFALGTMERALEKWRDRFRFTAAPGHIHPERARGYELLDPSVWTLERDLAAQLSDLIARRGGGRQQQP